LPCGISLLAPNIEINGACISWLPLWKTRSLAISSSAFKIALLALKISSRKTSSASTSFPAVMRRYSSRFSPATDTGPNNSSGVVKRVIRYAKLRSPAPFCGPMRSARLVTNADFAVPGGPRTTRCCRASNATREARMTSSRSISDAVNSRSMTCSLSRGGSIDARLGVVDIAITFRPFARRFHLSVSLGEAA
jgi:hypothetical protein